MKIFWFLLLLGYQPPRMPVKLNLLLLKAWRFIYFLLHHPWLRHGRSAGMQPTNRYVLQKAPRAPRKGLCTCCLPGSFDWVVSWNGKLDSWVMSSAGCWGEDIDLMKISVRMGDSGFIFDWMAKNWHGNFLYLVLCLIIEVWSFVCVFWGIERWLRYILPLLHSDSLSTALTTIILKTFEPLRFDILCILKVVWMNKWKVTLGETTSEILRAVKARTGEWHHGPHDSGWIST